MDILSYLVSDSDIWSDPRSQDWFLIRKPLHVLMITAAYVLFSTKIGPTIMKNRKPFKLNRIMQIYNLFQVIGCTIILIQVVRIIINVKYNILCSPINRYTDYWNMKIVEYHWYFFMFKLIDLADTVFFVLRKKSNQINFLHLYHHSSMVLISWFFTKYSAGGQIGVAALLNTFVHIIMYFYYFLASLGPQHNKYLWFKKYVTRLQIGQFLIILLHAIQGAIWDCGYPKSLTLVLVFNASIFLYLFGKFYIRSYLRRNTTSTKKNN